MQPGTVHEPKDTVVGQRRTGRDETEVPEALMVQHAWERPGEARIGDVLRLSQLIGNRAMAQRLTSSAMVQRAAVKETKLNGVSLVAEVGADFRNNHMAPDVEKAKELSKSRVSRSDKNTVVLSSVSEVASAMSNAPYTASPLLVSGLNWVKVISKPKTAITPAAVTSQEVQQGTSVAKIKVRLVADDEAKLTTSPTSNDNGPIVLATGVQG